MKVRWNLEGYVDAVFKVGQSQMDMCSSASYCPTGSSSNNWRTAKHFQSRDVRNDSLPEKPYTHTTHTTILIILASVALIVFKCPYLKQLGIEGISFTLLYLLAAFLGDCRLAYQKR